MLARTLLAATSMVVFLSAPALAQDGSTVFAAASLKNALDAVNEACTAEVGSTATISSAESSRAASPPASSR